MAGVTVSARPRACAQCGAKDREIYVPEAEAEHWIVPFWQPQQKELNAGQRAQGWQRREFQGLPGIERLLCRDCINDNARRDRIWREMRSAAEKIEKQEDENPYLILCEA